MREVLSLFRVLFPTWKFFDEFASVPTLHARVGNGPWRRLLPPHVRRLSALFLNAQVNLTLAYDSLLVRTVQELQDLSEHQNFAQTVTYQMLHALVREQLVDLQPNYQFKLVLTALDAKGDGEEILISPRYTSADPLGANE